MFFTEQAGRNTLKNKKSEMNWKRWKLRLSYNEVEVDLNKLKNMEERSRNNLAHKAQS